MAQVTIHLRSGAKITAASERVGATVHGLLVEGDPATSNEPCQLFLFSTIVSITGPKAALIELDSPA
jgi:hypothetical protein